MEWRIVSSVSFEMPVSAHSEGRSHREGSMRSFILLASSSVAAAAVLCSPSVVRADDAAAAPPPAAAAPATPAPPAAPAAPAGEAPAPSGNHPSPNSVYLEGLGAGLLYSLNYERMVNDDLGVRIGFSYMSFSAASSDPTTGQSTSASTSIVAVPITASYIGLRGRKSSLELGGGAEMIYVASSSGSSSLGVSASGAGIVPAGIAMVGYRLHPVDNPGFQFRIGVMGIFGPGLSLSSNNPGAVGVIPWPYISFGASF
jgi:hypothetical protein